MVTSLRELLAVAGQEGGCRVRVCKWCGWLFVVTTGQQRYCSSNHADLHKVTAYRARRRAAAKREDLLLIGDEV